MNLYVTNLGDKITSESLEIMFATYGKVSSSEIVKDQHQLSGYSPVFAYVEMPNDGEAETAIKKIDGTVVDGRSISVSQTGPKSSETRTYINKLHRF
jgi:RNA recognition motif-containing protein